MTELKVTNYLIRNEDSELMRIVGRQEEARDIIRTRLGWTFKCLRTPKPLIDLSQFQEALI